METSREKKIEEKKKKGGRRKVSRGFRVCPECRGESPNKDNCPKCFGAGEVPIWEFLFRKP